MILLLFQHYSACWRQSTARFECQEQLPLCFLLLSPGSRVWSEVETGTQGCKKCFYPLSCSNLSAFISASSSKQVASLRCFAHGRRLIVCSTVWIWCLRCFICDLLRISCCWKLSSWFCISNLSDEDGLSWSEMLNLCTIPLSIPRRHRIWPVARYFYWDIFSQKSQDYFSNTHPFLSEFP